jgi:glutathione S-transferase
MSYTLYIGNKNYSTWSLRGWLLVRLTGAPFTEKVVSLNANEQAGVYKDFSPSGLVPCLVDGDNIVWDSLAIAEYLAERHPGVWPGDSRARARARSICAEMHSGFRHLRSEMAMCIRERDDVRPWAPALVREIDRMAVIWNETLTRFGGEGGMLFGTFCAADAFFAPVAFRFRTYGVEPPGEAGTYMKALLAHPYVQEWERAALAETEIVEADEPRVLYRDKLARSAE